MLTFASFSFLVLLLMPIAVSVVGGDSIAGEAGAGTLRYLLAAPAGRTRLLVVKYLNAVVFAYAVTVGGGAVGAGHRADPVPGGAGDAAVGQHRSRWPRACCGS